MINNFIETRATKMFAEDGNVCAALILLNTTIILQSNSHLAMSTENFLSGLRNWLAGDFVILTFCLIINIFLGHLPSVKRIIHGILIGLSAIIFVSNAFVMYKFGIALAKERLDIPATTDPVTAFEFLIDYALSPKIIIGIIAIVGAMAFATKIFGAFIERHIKAFATALKTFIIGYIFAWLVMLFSFITLPFSDTSRILGKIVISWFQPTNSISLALTLGGIRDSYESLGTDDIVFAAMDAQHEEIISDEADIPFVIFILGESTDRNHMHLYGYHLPTTPLLDKLHGDNELLRFDDTISCACYTLKALSMIFTFTEYEDKDEWYTKPNLFDILNRAGYHTVLLSNQSSLGFYGNIDRIYGARSRECVFVDKDGALDRKPDEVLLPLLDESLQNNAHDKNFYVIHLEGTHQKYDRRYPPSFNKFGADDEDKPTAYQRQLTAEYDNAVLYNDYIVANIIDRFKDKDAVAVYISDHGETVFDGGDFAGHGDEERGINNTIEIPMLIWTSKEFRIRHHDKYQKMLSAVERPYMTDWIIHSLLDLMSIQTTSFEPRKSIFNESFDGSRARMFGDKIYSKNG